MVVASVTALIVFFIVIAIDCVFSSFLLIATFKVIDPHLNKQELRLGFKLAFQLHSIVYGLIFVAIIFSFITGSPSAFSSLALFSGIVYLVLLIKWFEMDLGTLILTYIVQGILGFALTLLLTGLISGLLSIAL